MATFTGRISDPLENLIGRFVDQNRSIFSHCSLGAAEIDYSFERYFGKSKMASPN